MACGGENTWLLRASAGPGAPYLLVYLVNSRPFSVVTPERLLIDLVVHL